MGEKKKDVKKIKNNEKKKEVKEMKRKMKKLGGWRRVGPLYCSGNKKMRKRNKQKR